ncbi:hypothetical protein NHQ30_009031 [Ciborinia camelliae]|nr:hypothetical protein NHQ30_009031 [Ciborinia camelliae]
MPPEEVECKDPMQKWLLEVTYETFENAGLSLQEGNVSYTSVHIGSFTADYNTILGKDPQNPHNACYNSPQSFTLSGDETSILKLETMLKQEGVPARKLQVHCAYHSKQMHGAAEDYQNHLQNLDTGNALADFLDMSSSTTGKNISVDEVSNANIGSLKDTINASPGPKKIAYSSILIRNRSALSTAVNAAGKMYRAGINLDIDKVNNPGGALEQRRMLVNDDCLYPASGMLVMAIEAARQTSIMSRKYGEFRFRDVQILWELRIPLTDDGIDFEFYLPPRRQWPNIQEHVIHPVALDSILQLSFVPITNGGKNLIPILVPTTFRELWISAGIWSQDRLVKNQDISNNISIFTQAKLQGSKGGASIVAVNTESKELHIFGEFVGSSAGHSTMPSEHVLIRGGGLCYNVSWKPDVNLLRQSYPFSEVEKSFVPPVPDFLSPEKKLLIQLALSRLLGSSPDQEILKGNPTLRKYLDWAQYHLNLNENQQAISVDDESAFQTLCDRIESNDPEGQLLVRVLKNLGYIFQGKVQALEVLFQDNLTTKYYQFINQMTPPYSQGMVYLDFLAHKQPNIKVLEIGAGTGSTREIVLETLTFCKDSNGKITLPKGMDFFIMLASISGILGHHGQANYACGNTYQDAFAQYRCQLGEKATSLDIGIVSNVGWVAEQNVVPGASVNLQDLLAIRVSEPELYAVLDYCCDPALPLQTAPYSQTWIGQVQIEQNNAGLSDPNWMKLPITRSLRQISTHNISGNADESSIDYKSVINAANSPAKVTDIIISGLQNKLSRTLGMGKEDIDAERPMHTYGVDFLSAVEVRLWFKNFIGVDISLSLRDHGK